MTFHPVLGVARSRTTHRTADKTRLLQDETSASDTGLNEEKQNKRNILRHRSGELPVLMELSYRNMSFSKKRFKTQKQPQTL